jgi:hypothetical protein
MLDPATVQILFADLQPPIVARSKTNPPQSLNCAASVLARCARLLSLPVHHSVVRRGARRRRCCQTSQRKPRVRRNSLA